MEMWRLFCNFYDSLLPAAASLFFQHGPVKIQEPFMALRAALLPKLAIVNSAHLPFTTLPPPVHIVHLHFASQHCIADHHQWCTDQQCSLHCICQCSLPYYGTMLHEVTKYDNFPLPIHKSPMLNHTRLKQKLAGKKKSKATEKTYFTLCNAQLLFLA